MSDNLTIFGVDYTGVTGIKATGTGNGTLAYIRPQGNLSITQNGTGIDVSQYATASVSVSAVDSTFVVTVSYDSSTQKWEPDCTYAEVLAAANANKTITVQSDSPVPTSADGYWVGDPDYMLRYSVSELSQDGLTVTNYEYEFSSIGLYEFRDEYIYPNFQAKTNVTPTTSSQTITPDSGYNGLSSVQIDAMPSGAAGTPTATKGTVSNHSVSVTPSVTNTTGYITGGTKTGTAVSVSASELVSGTLSITSSGTKDVTNYASASVAAGSATPASTISATSATVSTGTNTLTLSKTVSNTPQVSAGYVASGTAGNSSVSLTASVTTQGAQTIHPSTSDQSIAASRYLTGAQTIKAVTTSNLTAENIKQGVTVTIGDSTDADCVASVTGTYSGGGSSMNVQVAQSTTRSTSTSGTNVISLTCSKAGTYTVRWSTFRTSTSGTWGSRLYIGGSAYETMQTGGWTNHIQNREVTGVSISANQAVAVYVQSRGSNYYGYVGTLTIVQTA